MEQRKRTKVLFEYVSQNSLGKHEASLCELNLARRTMMCDVSMRKQGVCKGNSRGDDELSCVVSQVIDESFFQLLW